MPSHDLPWPFHDPFMTFHGPPMTFDELPRPSNGILSRTVVDQGVAFHDRP